MSRHVDFLPLGSVVSVKNIDDEYFIICQRCVFSTDNNEKYQLYDYGCTRYPYGILNHDLYYFNSDKIDKIIFKGYDEEENKKIVENMNEYLAENDEYKFSFWDKMSTFWENWVK